MAEAAVLVGFLVFVGVGLWLVRGVGRDAPFSRYRLHVPAPVALGGTTYAMLELVPQAGAVAFDLSATVLELRCEEHAVKYGGRNDEPEWQTHVLARVEVPLELPTTLSEPLQHRVPVTVPATFQPTWAGRNQGLRTTLALVLARPGATALHLEAPVEVLPEFAS